MIVDLLKMRASDEEQMPMLQTKQKQRKEGW
jgi:hypothetical protein